jgi:hypothetical protein
MPETQGDHTRSCMHAKLSSMAKPHLESGDLSMLVMVSYLESPNLRAMQHTTERMG